MDEATIGGRMKRKSILLLIIFFSPYFRLLAQENKIDQKKGALQNITERHISFHDFMEYDFKKSSIAFNKITDIEIYKGKIYILDSQQNRVFVFNKSLNYLNAMGRPGQGPGDLEYSSDIAVSTNGEIYVINRIAKRIEVFSDEGKYLKRIQLKLPKEIYYSHPNRILVSLNHLYIGYSLCPNLIDIYNHSGDYESTTLYRDGEKIIIPGEYIGNCSQISLLNNEKSLLHFNQFSGVFTKVSNEGGTRITFSVFDEYLKESIIKCHEILKERQRKKSPGNHVLEIVHWSNFCLDEYNNIYVFLTAKKKGTKQKLFVFSKTGDFLYWTYIPYFDDKMIAKIFYLNGTFAFVTLDEDLFFANKK